MQKTTITREGDQWVAQQILTIFPEDDNNSSRGFKGEHLFWIKNGSTMQGSLWWDCLDQEWQLKVTRLKISITFQNSDLLIDKLKELKLRILITCMR